MTPESRSWRICTSANATINRAMSRSRSIAYLAAVKIDPYLVPARQGLAEIYMSRGNFPAAAEQYSILLKGPHPDTEAALSLARIMIMMRLREDKEKRDWEPVDKLLDQIERQKALTPNVAVLKAEVLLAKDDPKDADEPKAAVERGAAAKSISKNAPRSSPRASRYGWP